MPAQKGRDLLIKLGNGSGGFKTVAGLRAKSLKLNSKFVDVTTSDSLDGWRELLPGAGIKFAEISGSGIFQDAASDAEIRTAFFNQETPYFQIIIPDFGILTGKFLISELTYSGTYSGEATFDIGVASAGVLSFSSL